MISNFKFKFNFKFEIGIKKILLNRIHVII